MANVENVEEIVAEAVATESGGAVRTESGGRWRQSPAGRRQPVTRRWRRLVTNETTATGGVMYTDEGELEFDEDEMAALEGQRLFAEFTCGIY